PAMRATRIERDGSRPATRAARIERDGGRPAMRATRIERGISRAWREQRCGPGTAARSASSFATGHGLPEPHAVRRDRSRLRLQCRLLCSCLLLLPPALLPLATATRRFGLRTGLHGQRDPVPLEVDAQHGDAHLLADLDDVVWIPDEAVREL